MERALLWLKAALFTVIVPGSVTLLLPYLILGRPRPLPQIDWGPLVALGEGAVVLGVAVYLRCLADFVRVGRGIPSPLEHPRRLVVRGLYRYVRNPMYLGVLLVLLGGAAIFRSAALLGYTLTWLAVVHLAVVLWEEPHLHRRFGDSYEEYRRGVGRWLPGAPTESRGESDPPVPPEAA